MRFFYACAAMSARLPQRADTVQKRSAHHSTCAGPLRQNPAAPREAASPRGASGGSPAPLAATRSRCHCLKSCRRARAHRARRRNRCLQLDHTVTRAVRAVLTGVGCERSQGAWAAPGAGAIGGDEVDHEVELPRAGAGRDRQAADTRARTPKSERSPAPRRSCGGLRPWENQPSKSQSGLHARPTRLLYVACAVTSPGAPAASRAVRRR